MTNSYYANGVVREGIRDSFDRYETPQEVTEVFLEHHSLDKKLKIVDPACGKNKRILKALKVKGYENISGSDLYYDGKDFLNSDEKCDVIITNPPYKNNLHLKFVQHGLNLANAVIMLVPITFLTTEKRYNFFKENKPAEIFIIPNRIRWYTEKENGEWDRISSQTFNHCWVVWDKYKLKENINLKFLPIIKERR